MNNLLNNSLPVSWIKPSSYQEINFFQRINDGKFRVSLTKDKFLYFSQIDNNEIIFNGNSEELNFFKTAIGSVGFFHAKKLFENLSGIASCDEYPFSLETWFKISSANFSNDFLEIWKYLIPCAPPANFNPIPIQLEVVSNTTGVEAILWAEAETCQKILDSSVVQLMEATYPPNKNMLKVDLNLIKLNLSASEFRDLENGDTILSKDILFSKNGIGKICLAHKLIDVELLNDGPIWQLKVIEIKENTSKTDSVRYAGNLQMSPNFLELAMNEEWDDVEPDFNAEQIDQDYDTANDQPPALSCAKVTIDACLGSFTIDYSSIGKLQQGDLIRIHTDYDGSISLRNHGNEIGIARVVSINDELALQIDKLWR